MKPSYIVNGDARLPAEYILGCVEGTKLVNTWRYRHSKMIYYRGCQVIENARKVKTEARLISKNDVKRESRAHDISPEEE